MKRIYSDISRLASLLLVFTTITTACKDEVELPRAFVTPDTERIVAPAMAATFNVEIDANCEWIAEIDNDAAWVSIPEEKRIGKGTLAISVEKNTSGAKRTLDIKIHDSKNTVFSTLSLEQNPQSGDGFTSISDLRSIISSGNISVPEGLKIRGIVVSNQRNGNINENTIAIEDNTEPGSGVAVRTQSRVFVSPGEEIEIDLSGASFDSKEGMLTAVPASDDRISRTESSCIDPMPVEVSVKDLENSDYESMYVSIKSQVAYQDIRKETISENISIQDAEGSFLPLLVLQGCQFADIPVPTGGGTVSGLIRYVDGKAAIMPCSSSDISLSSSRFDGGIMLPYVFSLMTEGSNDHGRYVDFIKDASDANKTYMEAKDGTGATLNVNLNAKSKTFYYWNENSGHHNLQLASWLDGNKNYIQLAFPLGQELKDGFRLSFGLASQKNAPANWELQYSTDNSSWITSPNKISIPKGEVFGGGKGYFYFTIETPLSMPIESKSTLYVRLRPADKVSISGGALSDGYGRIALHSCVVLSAITAEKTSSPAGAIYFEPFDGLTQGTDYRQGDRLGGMLNYCGEDIQGWNAEITKGLTGTNVRQRPGYAQIGFVESQTVNQTKYINNVGILTTPALNVSGNINLRFKAMAYKNTSVFQSGNNTAADISGDVTSAIVEIVGSGTINGKKSAEITSLGYSSFKTYNFEIKNSSSDTKIRFTSDGSKGGFTRWFIDEICISK